MVEHSEFPWGPQLEPGLLTPLGVFGWLVAAALLVLLLVRARGGGGEGGGRKLGDAIDWKYKAVARAARHAARADQDEVLKAHKTLRHVIERAFGNLDLAGGGLAAQLKLLDKARSGERDDDHGHGDHDDHAHDDHGHDDDHGHAPAERHGAAAEVVQGPNVTVNVGVLTDERPAKPGKPPKPKPAPPTFKEQLAQLQDALQAFNAWWGQESKRTNDLRAARADLIGPPRIPDDLEKLIEGLK